MINLIYIIIFFLGFLAHWLILFLMNKSKTASVVSTTYRNAKAKQLSEKRLSRSDQLTGFQSRNTFIKKSNRLTRKADAEGALVGFVSVDIKSFCRVNETYGFKVGDSILKEVSKPHLNILTAEDPVEFELDGVGQVQVKEDIGYTFASALRFFLRQDPEIILVGEMRDKETVDIGLKAALTGHLVFSTLHTNDAPSTITRLQNMGTPDY